MSPARIHVAVIAWLGFAVLMAATAAATDATAVATRPAVPSAVTDTSVTTVILVRHAERNDAFLGSDPPLTRDGEARAAELVHVLAASHIASVYVTEFARTRMTGEPVAKLIGDSVRVLRGSDFAAQARRILTENHGRTALVVGHSNTIPQLITALTGRPATFDGGFDPLYVVTIQSGGTTMTRLNYGAPSPPESAPATRAGTPPGAPPGLPGAGMTGGGWLRNATPDSTSH